VLQADNSRFAALWYTAIIPRVELRFRNGPKARSAFPLISKRVRRGFGTAAARAADFLVFYIQVYGGINVNGIID
jgi:hypothetical protein